MELICGKVKWMEMDENHDEKGLCYYLCWTFWHCCQSLLFHLM